MAIKTHLKITFIITFLRGLMYCNLFNFNCKCEAISSFEVVLEYFLLILCWLGSVIRKPFSKRHQIKSPSGLNIGSKILSQRHKVLGFLNNVFSISAKNVFNFFIGMFVLFLCFAYQKAMCYVSLKFQASKLKQDFTMIVQKCAMFFFPWRCLH